MANKEGKFFEQLAFLTEDCNEAGTIFKKLVNEEISIADGIDGIHDIKKRVRASLGKLYEKMYKVYKGPEEVELAKGFILKMYGIVDLIHEVLDRFAVYNMEDAPKGFKPMAELVGCALEEMKKVLDYTSDIESNYMKMEARCRKIYAFEERGDEFYREEIRNLFSQDKEAVYIIYWKDILSDTERMLDMSAGAVVLLQRLFARG